MTPTPLDNFHRMMRGDDCDWLPLNLPMTPPVLDRMQQRRGSRDAVEAFDIDLVYAGVGIGGRRDEWAAAYAELGVELTDDLLLDAKTGSLHRKPDAASVGEAYHFMEMLHPLEHVTELKQLESLPWPRERDWREASKDYPAQVEALHARGRAVCGANACTCFEAAWYLRGMDQLLFDLHEGADLGGWLLDKICHISRRQALANCEAGVDMIQFGDDVGMQTGMMMHPDFWRQHFKPRLAATIAFVREHERRHTYIAYHSDGNITDIVDDLIEIGVEVLNPLQPECMPVRETIERFKDRLAFWGLIGTQTTMPFGTPDEVRAVVKEAYDLAAQGARIVLAPTHVLEPDVPWENIEALVQAAQQPRMQAARG